MKLDEFARRLADRQEALTEMLRGFVELESGSYDTPGVNAAGAELSARFAGLGFAIERLPQAETGDHLVATRQGRGAGRLLVLVHLDTVWPAGTLAEMPFRIEDGRAFGPGVLDMRGGWVVLLAALEGLYDTGWDGFETITIFMTADEELGSPSARKAIEELAARHDWALVMESARESGNIVTKRGGVGALFVDVGGVTAHPMSSAPGASAIVEAAHIAIALEQLTARDEGLIVNVGIISGGTARQVVPDHVRMTVDLRAPTPAQAEQLLSRVREIVVHRTVPGTSATLSGGITRPAFPHDQASTELFATLSSCAAALGMTVGGEATRAGSDGNFTAALGIATLDGLGPEGANGCTRSEYVILDSIPRRSALLAALMSETSGTPAFTVSG